MSAFTDTAENKLIDWYFRGQALGFANSSAGAGSGPTNLYIGLLSVAPTDSSAGTELSGGSYARVGVASSLANWAGTQSAGSTAASSGTSGTTSNNNVITFPTATADWSAAVAVGIWDAASGGTLLKYTSITSKTVQNGDTLSCAAGAVTFQWDN